MTSRDVGVRSQPHLQRVQAEVGEDGVRGVGAVAARGPRGQVGRPQVRPAEPHPRWAVAGEVGLGIFGADVELLATVRTPDGRALFSIPKLHLFQGDRIVLLGRNGTGKSQFMKLMTRAMQGEEVPGVRVTTSLRLGATDQEMSQLPMTGSPFDLIAGYRQGDQRTKALLAAAGFPIEKQDRPIGTLSFGRRSRLALLSLRLSEPNFYLMDEPTNHVDISGQEQLEAEILEHGASCILVSHDRSFVRNIGTRFIEITGHRVTEVDSPERFLRSFDGE